MNKIITSMLIITLLVIYGFVFSVPVSASTRTIIVPDDYPTLASAIGNATDGDTILIRSGNYLEKSLTINKTISLIGENAQNTIIRNIDQPTMYLGSALLAGPTTITVKANNVIISRLTVITNNTGADLLGYDVAGGGSGTQILNNNLPDGILLSSGTYQLITQNNIGQSIDYFAIISEAPYSYITSNTITGGVKLQNSNLNNVIYANSITTTTNSYDWEAWGINIYMSQGNLIAKNNITNSRAGIVNDLSSYNTIIGNTITNSYIGLATIQGGGENTYFGNNIISNSYSLATAGYKDTFYDNNFINNAQEIGNPDLLRGPNPSPITFWHKENQGNYWSNYSGVDENQDGIGDTPYLINADNTDPYPLMASFNLTTVTLPDWASSISPAVLPSTFPPPAETTAPTASPSPTTTVPEYPGIITFTILLLVTTIVIAYCKKKTKVTILS